MTEWTMEEEALGLSLVFAFAFFLAKQWKLLHLFGCIAGGTWGNC